MFFFVVDFRKLLNHSLCVSPLVCARCRSDFLVNFFYDRFAYTTKVAFSRVYQSACWVIFEVFLVVLKRNKGLPMCHDLDFLAYVMFGRDLFQFLVDLVC